MKNGRRTLSGMVIAAAMTLASVATAHASISLSTSTNKCTVTAIAPTLSKTSLTGRATIVCSMATTVTLLIGVAEMDSGIEDTRVPIAVASKSVAVKANTAVTVLTSTLTCLNTETGNEEYASKAAINLSGTTSAYDRYVPTNDQFAC